MSILPEESLRPLTQLTTTSGGFIKYPQNIMIGVKEFNEAIKEAEISEWRHLSVGEIYEIVDYVIMESPYPLREQRRHEADGKRPGRSAIHRVGARGSKNNAYVPAWREPREPRPTLTSAAMVLRPASTGALTRCGWIQRRTCTFRGLATGKRHRL